MPKRITPKYKRVVDPIIIKRDGHVCFFDKMPFVPEVLKWSKTYHHLIHSLQREQNFVPSIEYQDCANFVFLALCLRHIPLQCLFCEVVLLLIKLQLIFYLYFFVDDRNDHSSHLCIHCTTRFHNHLISAYSLLYSLTT